jgi:hypothetical protein
MERVAELAICGIAVVVLASIGIIGILGVLAVTLKFLESVMDWKEGDE